MVTVKRNDAAIEIRDVDDLYRVLKEVRAAAEPLVIQTDDGDEIVFKAGRHRHGKRRTAEERAKADDAAFLASAGSWRGHLDPEEFKKQIKEARSSNRPVVSFARPDE